MAIKTFHDTASCVDHASLEAVNRRPNYKGNYTEIFLKDPVTGEVLFKTHNRVVIAGSQFTAMKHFDLPELISLPTYNQDLGLDNSLVHGTTPINVPKICLFGCGIDGCGAENSQVYPVKYTGRINPLTGLVPFRYQLANNDLSAEQRQKYFGKKTADGRYAYYFKAFETEPEMHAQYVDGTIIDQNVYDSQNTSDAEFYVEMTLKILKEDFREYFTETTGINSAKINTISLMQAWYNEVDGYKVYQDISPVTQLNIPNEALIDPTKGIDIVYHIYY